MYWALGTTSVHEPPKEPGEDHVDSLLGLDRSRSGTYLATITKSVLHIWHLDPLSIVATIKRSQTSLTNYGENAAVMLRPDCTAAIIQTTKSYLVVYALLPNQEHVSLLDVSNGSGRIGRFSKTVATGSVAGCKVRFRMVIKVDAGVQSAIAMDERLIISTKSPAGIQIVPWENSASNSQTDLLVDLTWLGIESLQSVASITYDRPTNLSIWIMHDGRAFAVISHPDADQPNRRRWKGWCFIDMKDDHATCAAVSARFSLLAVGTTSGSIHVHSAKDYSGHIPLSHSHSPPPSSSVRTPSMESTSSGSVTFLSYSPDGYALLAGYEHGWALWSVFGQLLITSFAAQDPMRNANDGLTGAVAGCWAASGLAFHIIAKSSTKIHTIDLLRSTVPGCFIPDNVLRPTLQTQSSLLIYQGVSHSALSVISPEALLYNRVPYPSAYVTNNLPIKCCAISRDGNFIAIAGQRGFAHYSIRSGRWKWVFGDSAFEDASLHLTTEPDRGVTVRGGMCWYKHTLAVALEDEERYEIRLYAREGPQEYPVVHHVESFNSPIVVMSLIEDSLLVYTQKNQLHHYVFMDLPRDNGNPAGGVKIVLAGLVNFEGIVHSPLRVRAVSWMLDSEFGRDDPTHDIAHAIIFLLVDGKLVTLRPKTVANPDQNVNDEAVIEAEIRYELHTLAERIEFYSLLPASSFQPYIENAEHSAPTALSTSLWAFDGKEVKIWMDLQSYFADGSMSLPRSPSIVLPVSFYPLSILPGKGVITGIEGEIMQRHNVNLSIFRFNPSSSLILNKILRWLLDVGKIEDAVQLAERYTTLEYFSHVLELLLHEVLDEEVDNLDTQTPVAAEPCIPDKHFRDTSNNSPQSPTSTTHINGTPSTQPLLARVVAFLSHFPREMLDVVVGCTRKTEMRSWRYLFGYVGPPKVLFERALAYGMLKTAGAYLIVLDTLEQFMDSHQNDVVRLMRRAIEVEDWDLCKELSRFLTSLDHSGDALRRALKAVDIRIWDDRHPLHESAHGMVD